MSTSSLYTFTTPQAVSANNLTSLYQHGAGTINPQVGYGNANVQDFLAVGSDVGGNIGSTTSRFPNRGLAHDGHNQARLERNRHTEVEAFPEHHGVAVERGVDERVPPERRRDGPGDERQVRELEPFALHPCVADRRARLLNAMKIDFDRLQHVRNGLGLDRGHGFIAHFGYRASERFGQIQVSVKLRYRNGFVHESLEVSGR